MTQVAAGGGLAPERLVPRGVPHVVHDAGPEQMERHLLAAGDHVPDRARDLLHLRLKSFRLSLYDRMHLPAAHADECRVREAAPSISHLDIISSP